MRTSTFAAFWALLAVGIGSRAGHAQAWLSDRGQTEGAGIRTGDVELHPGIGGEFGYDSNYFQRAGVDAADRAGGGLGGRRLLRLQNATAERERVVPLLRLRVTPHFALSTLGPQRSAVDRGEAAPPDLSFRAQTALRYNEFFPVTDDGDLVRDQRHLAFDIGGKLDIAPYGNFGADLQAQYVRTVEPSNAFDTDSAFDRATVNGGGGLSWRPGGGLFSWRLGYGLLATLFQDSEFEDMGNLQHTISSSGRWRFLPRTALLSESSIGLVRYGSGNDAHNGGDLVKTALGLNGLITYHLGFLALAGWGASFYVAENVPAENFDGFIGQLELTWYPTPQAALPDSAGLPGVSAVSLGYTRDFANSYFGDYYQADRFYGRVSYAFGGGVFLVSAGGGFSLVTRPTIHFSDGRNNGSLGGFVERRVDSSLFLEYRVADSVGINATVRYDANLTEQQVPNGTQASEGVDDLSFNRFQAYVGARWFL